MIITYDEEGKEIKSKEPFIINFFKSKDFLTFMDDRRKFKGITMKKIGAYLKVTEATISRILSGKANTSIDNYIKILRFLGYRLTVEEILYPDDDDWFPSDEEIQEMDEISMFEDNVLDFDSEVHYYKEEENK